MPPAEGGVLWHPCEGGFSLAEGSGFVKGWKGPQRRSPRMERDGLKSMKGGKTGYPPPGRSEPAPPLRWG